MIDLGRGECTPFGALIEEVIEMLTEDAAALGCLNEVQHARTILKRGTSACRQLDIFKEVKDAGADDKEALVAVVDMLVDETAADLPGF